MRFELIIDHQGNVTATEVEELELERSTEGYVAVSDARALRSLLRHVAAGHPVICGQCRSPLVRRGPLVVCWTDEDHLRLHFG